MPPLARLVRSREEGAAAAAAARRQHFERCAAAPPAWLRRLGVASTMALHDGCVNTATWSADGQWLLTGSDDCTIALTRADRHRANPAVADLRWDSLHAANVFCAKLLGDGPVGAGSVVASCALDGQVRVHTLQEGRRIGTRRLHRHSRAAHKLAASAVQPHVFASGGEDGRVVLFDLRAATPAVFSFALQRSELALDLYALHALEFRPAAPTQLLLAGGDHVVRLFDLRHVPHAVTPAACYHPGTRRDGGGGDTCSGGSAAAQQPAPPSADRFDEHVSVTGAAWNWSGSAFVATLNDEHAYLMHADADATTSASLQPSATAFAPIHAGGSAEPAGRHPRLRTPIGLPLKLRALPPEQDGSDSLLGWAPTKPSTRQASSPDALLAATRFNPEWPAARHWWHTLPGRRSSAAAALAAPPPPRAGDGGGGTFSQCYRGHRNICTVKGVAFFGARSELVVQGCDSGVVFFYDTASGRILRAVRGDAIGAVNCLSPHPLGLPMLLTSGLESSAKLWAPLGSHDDPPPHLSAEELQALVDQNNLERGLHFVPDPSDFDDDGSSEGEEEEEEEEEDGTDTDVYAAAGDAATTGSDDELESHPSSEASDDEDAEMDPEEEVVDAL